MPKRPVKFPFKVGEIIETDFHAMDRVWEKYKICDIVKSSNFGSGFGVILEPLPACTCCNRPFPEIDNIIDSAWCRKPKN